MATTTTTVLNDGPRNAVIKLTANLDPSDYENEVVKVDVSTLSPNPGDGAQATNVSVLGIMFSTTNVEVELQWEGQGNPIFYTLPSYFAHKVSFKEVGGITNDAPSRTGNILLTTKTRTVPSLDAQYVITLWLKKKYD
jgi:hypothetical protein